MNLRAALQEPRYYEGLEKDGDICKGCDPQERKPRTTIGYCEAKCFPGNNPKCAGVMWFIEVRSSMGCYEMQWGGSLGKSWALEVC